MATPEFDFSKLASPRRGEYDALKNININGPIREKTCKDNVDPETVARYEKYMKFAADIEDFHKHIASIKLHLVPCYPNVKKPMILKWNEHQDTLPEYPTLYHKNFNVSVVTGKNSSLVIIDLDKVKDPKTEICGIEYWKQLLSVYNGNQHIKTWIFQTPTGGYHIYFRYSASICKLKTAAKIIDRTDVDNKKKKVCIDFLTNNGKGMLPGSITKDGIYDLVEGCDPRTTPIAEMPQWLVDILFNSRANPECKEYHTLGADKKKGKSKYTLKKDEVLPFIIMLLSYLNIRRVNDRKSWIYIMSLVKTIVNGFEIHDDAMGFEIIDQWSRLSSKYSQGEIYQQAPYQWCYIKGFELMSPTHALNILKKLAVDDSLLDPPGLAKLRDNVKKFIAKNGNYKVYKARDWRDMFGDNPVEEEIHKQDREWLVNAFGLQIFDKDSKESVNDIKELIKKKNVTETDVVELLKKTVAHISNGGDEFYIFKTFDNIGEMIYTDKASVAGFAKYHIWYDKKKVVKGVETTIKKRKSVKEIIEDHAVKEFSYNSVVYRPYSKFEDNVFKVILEEKHEFVEDHMETSYVKNNFNKFSGFKYDYNPGLKVDVSLFLPILIFIKQILCGVECTTEVTRDPNGGRSYTGVTCKDHENCPCWKDPVYIHFINLLAWYLQKPHKKPKVMIVLGGNMRVGKSYFIRYFCKYLMGRRYFYVVSDPKQLENRFNSCKTGIQFLLYEEPTSWGGNELANNAMKFEISESYMEVEIKNGPRYKMKVYYNSAISTNGTNPVGIEHGDERFFCLWAEARYTKEQKEEFFKPIKNAWKNEEVMRHFHHYLMKIDLSKYKPGNIPNTWWRDYMASKSTKHTDNFFYRIMENQGCNGMDTEGWIHGGNLYEAYKTYCEHEGIDKPLGKVNFNREVRRIFASHGFREMEEKTINNVKGYQAFRINYMSLLRQQRILNDKFLNNFYDKDLKYIGQIAGVGHNFDIVE